MKPRWMSEPAEGMKEGGVDGWVTKEMEENGEWMRECGGGEVGHWRERL